MFARLKDNLVSNFLAGAMIAAAAVWLKRLRTLGA